MRARLQAALFDQQSGFEHMHAHTIRTCRTDRSAHAETLHSAHVLCNVKVKPENLSSLYIYGYLPIHVTNPTDLTRPCKNVCMHVRLGAESFCSQGEVSFAGHGK